VEPWTSFKRARAALETGNMSVAITLLTTIVNTPEYETRISVQAWHF